MKKRSDNRKPDRRPAATGKRSRRPAIDEILPEYPAALIREGERGKYAARYRQRTERSDHRPRVTGTDPRSTIIDHYARWTALSALRSSSPIKSRNDVYSALESVDFTALFDVSNGTISVKEFDEWHERAVANLRKRERRLNVGWAAKILNVYLKTRCYIGGQGRHQLSDAIHPPIDGGLWLGLRGRFSGREDILGLSNCVERIKDINDYQCYARIISGCRLAATTLGCSLIEVEQLWTGTELKKQRI